MTIIFFELILVGLTLSLDAFALSIAIGSLINVRKNMIMRYASVVGIYHLIMPLLGYVIKNSLYTFIDIPSKELFIIVVIFLMFEIIFEKDSKKLQKFINPIVFGFTVSLDSLSIGIALNKIEIIYGPIFFMIISALITYLGFISTKKISNKKRKIASILLLIIVIILKLIK